MFRTNNCPRDLFLHTLHAINLHWPTYVQLPRIVCRSHGGYRGGGYSHGLDVLSPSCLVEVDVCNFDYGQFSRLLEITLSAATKSP